MKMKSTQIHAFLFALLFIASNSFSQVVNTTPVNLVGSSDPIPGPGGFIMHPFTPSPLTGTYHGGTFYGGTKERWGYNISGLTPGSVYTLTVYYMMDVVQGSPLYDRRGDMSLLSGAPLSIVLIPYVSPANWRVWYTLTTTFTAVGTTDRIDIEADGVSDNSLWLFTDMAIDGGGVCDDLTVTVSSTEICLGDELTLTGVSDNGGTITWDGGATNGTPFTPLTAGTITYTATSTSPDDCDYSVDILVNSLPLVTANADDTEICDGESVTLTGSGATTYVWDGGVTNGIPFTPAATATYMVTGTDVNGCENTDDITVTVNPLPLIDAGPDQTVCDGGSVTLSGAGAGVGGTYSWDGGITNGIAFAPIVTATYTVIGTDANGCTNSDDVLVSVSTSPAIDAGVDFAICDGESVLLSGAGAGVGGAYAWDGGVLDGISFTPAATATYIVIGSTAEGCEGTDDITITVNSVPVINAGADLTICAGESVTLAGAGAGVGGLYAWDGGVLDGIPFTPAATSTYTLTGINADGCSSTDNVIVTVNALPVINAGADLTICAGESVILSGAGAGIGGSYAWDGGVTNGISFVPVSTSTFTVIGTNAAGCEGTDNLMITVNPLPIIYFSADQTEGCKPFTVAFTSGALGASFEWNFGDGTTGTGAALSHTYNAVGAFDVTLTITSALGCSNSETYSDYILVVEPPVANFSYNIDDNSEVTNIVTFNNESDFATHYEWSFGDGSTNSTIEDPIHNYPVTTTQNYEVFLTATNEYGCSSTKLKVIRIEEKLLFFIPNTFTPDGDDFNDEFKPIFVSGLDVYDYHLLIFNRWGEIVFESYDANYGWDGYFGSAGLVEDGTYVWTIEFGEKMSDKLHFENGIINVFK